MNRPDFLAELDSRLKDAGFSDDVELDSDSIDEVIQPEGKDEVTPHDMITDEVNSLLEDVRSGDWDEE